MPFHYFFGLMLMFTAQWQRALNFSSILFVILMLFHRLKIHYYKQPLLIADFILAFDPRNWDTLLHYKSAIFAIAGLLALLVYAVFGFSSVDSLVSPVIASVRCCSFFPVELWRILISTLMRLKFG